jgi:hypothetical protein
MQRVEGCSPDRLNALVATVVVWCWDYITVVVRSVAPITEGRLF